MSKLVIVSREIYKGHPYAIHAEGCADVARTERKSQGPHCFETFEGTPDAAVAHVLDAELREMGYDESHVRVYPCCGKTSE